MKIRAYTSWAAVAGFFDGDGSIEEIVGEYVVGVVLGFTDNWPEQLAAVKRFLESESISLGGLTQRKWKGKASAWQLRICNVAGVLRAAKMMLPHCVKKKAELQAVIDYLEDRLTGDEFIRLVNCEVKIGNKAGKLKSSHLSMTRSVGNMLRRKNSLISAHAVIDTKVSVADAAAIRHLYRTGEYSMRRLGRIYGYKFWVIERILWKSYKTSQRVPTFKLKS